MSEELQSMVQIIELYGRGLGALGRVVCFSAKGAAKGVDVAKWRWYVFWATKTKSRDISRNCLKESEISALLKRYFTDKLSADHIYQRQLLCVFQVLRHSRQFANGNKVNLQIHPLVE